MNVTFHDVEQRSPEWIALRLGRLTASKAGDMSAQIKSGEAASRRNLRVQLALERITARAQERSYTSGPMLDGIEREPAALAHYEAMTGVLVRPIGFVSHNELMAGCSPDGLIGEDGLLSIKSPTPAIHWEYLRTGTVPRDYMLQIVHEFWITGRRWCDWMSYSSDFPDGAQVKLVRVERIEKDVKAYALLAHTFLDEVDLAVNEFRTLTGVREALAASVA